jgi:hypothetical protein
MAEATNYLFDYKEVAEALIKKQGLHEGLWHIGVEFGLAAQNIRTPNGFAPAAIIPVNKIGLSRTEEPNNMTVDAAKVNPAPGGAMKEASRQTTKKTAKKK